MTANSFTGTIQSDTTPNLPLWGDAEAPPRLDLIIQQRWQRAANNYVQMLWGGTTPNKPLPPESEGQFEDVALQRLRQASASARRGQREADLAALRNRFYPGVADWLSTQPLLGE